MPNAVSVMILVLGSRDLEVSRQQGVLRAMQKWPDAPITFSGRGKQLEYVPSPQREASRMLRGVAQAAAAKQHEPHFPVEHATPVLLEDRANNTADNFECSRALWLASCIAPKHVVIVTNPFHWSRARTLATLLWPPHRVPFTFEFFEDVPDPAVVAWRKKLEEDTLAANIAADAVGALLGPCSILPDLSSCAMLNAGGDARM